MNLNFVYDTSGNIVQASDHYPQVNFPNQLLIVDSNAPYAAAAFAQPQNFMVQGNNLVPAATIQITRQQIADGSYVDWLLNIVASDGQAHNVNLVMGSYTDTLTIPPTGLQMMIKLHVSLAAYAFSVAFSGSGLVTNGVPIGGSKTLPIGVQIAKDGSGVLHVTPAGPGSKNFLVGYWTMSVSPTSAMVDLATIDGIAMHTLFSLVIPALITAGTITLTDNQNNALQDIQANVLPNITTKLENLAPKPSIGDPQVLDLHYASYRRHIIDMAAAVQGYENDLATLSNLV